MGFALRNPFARRRAPATKSHLLEFYGVECDHCVEMHPLIDQLQAETGLTMRGFEVWFNQSNLKRTCGYALFVCGTALGVGFAARFSGLFGWPIGCRLQAAGLSHGASPLCCPILLISPLTCVFAPLVVSVAYVP